MEKKEYITLDDLLNKFNKNNTEYINQLEQEEKLEEKESIDDIEKEIKGDKLKTEIIKNRFIDEIKSGLGNNIKNNPSTIKKIEKTRGQKLKEFFKGLFTKF
jgi:hypothetical protein